MSPTPHATTTPGRPSGPRGRCSIGLDDAAAAESRPSGSFTEPSEDDERFWAKAVELDMPINVHTQFFFPYGDIGANITAEGVPQAAQRAKHLDGLRSGGYSLHLITGPHRYLQG